MIEADERRSIQDEQGLATRAMAEVSPEVARRVAATMNNSSFHESDRIHRARCCMADKREVNCWASYFVLFSACNYD
jgi:hypothetical protein